MTDTEVCEDCERLFERCKQAERQYKLFHVATPLSGKGHVSCVDSSELAAAMLNHITAEYEQNQHQLEKHPERAPENKEERSGGLGSMMRKIRDYVPWHHG